MSRLATSAIESDLSTVDQSSQLEKLQALLIDKPPQQSVVEYLANRDDLGADSVKEVLDLVRGIEDALTERDGQHEISRLFRTHEAVPPLLEKFPALAEQIPHIPLISGSTPIDLMDLDGVPHGKVFMKRDDLADATYAGNKVRKFEYILGDALAQGATMVVTTGTLASNHGLGTAIYAEELGLKSTLVLGHEAVTPRVKEMLLADQSYGAEIVVAKDKRAAINDIVERAEQAGEKPYRISAGGSSDLGNLGHVDAAFELAAQIQNGVMPEPGRIVMTIGSGGMVAGAVLGLKLSGLDIPVHSFDVVGSWTPKKLADMANRTLEFLREKDPSIPNVSITEADFIVDKSELGEGFTIPTEDGQRALEDARKIGVELEPTFSAKTVSGLRKLAQDPSVDGPLLYFGTYNGQPLSPPTEATVQDLPRQVQELLAETEPA